MLISADTYRIVHSQFISINLERVDILMSIFLTNLYTHAKKKHSKKIYICIYAACQDSYGKCSTSAGA